MKGNKSRNIFAEISKEANEEKKAAAKKPIIKEETPQTEQEATVNKEPEEEYVEPELEEEEEAIEEDPIEETPVVTASEPVVEETVTQRAIAPERVEPQANQGVLFITPTRKMTRHNRKGFLLSDLALKNLQSEAGKYEISENELINQILEKMV